MKKGGFHFLFGFRRHLLTLNTSVFLDFLGLLWKKYTLSLSDILYSVIDYLSVMYVQQYLRGLCRPHRTIRAVTRHHQEVGSWVWVLLNVPMWQTWCSCERLRHTVGLRSFECIRSYRKSSWVVSCRVPLIQTHSSIRLPRFGFAIEQFWGLVLEGSGVATRRSTIRGRPTLLMFECVGLSPWVVWEQSDMRLSNLFHVKNFNPEVTKTTQELSMTATRVHACVDVCLTPTR